MTYHECDQNVHKNKGLHKKSSIVRSKSPLGPLTSGRASKASSMVKTYSWCTVPKKLLTSQMVVGVVFWQRKRKKRWHLKCGGGAAKPVFSFHVCCLKNEVKSRTKGSSMVSWFNRTGAIHNIKLTIILSYKYFMWNIQTNIYIYSDFLIYIYRNITCQKPPCPSLTKCFPTHQNWNPFSLPPWPPSSRGLRNSVQNSSMGLVYEHQHEENPHQNQPFIIGKYQIYLFLEQKKG